MRYATPAHELDPFVRKLPGKHFGHVGVLARGEPWPALQHGHARAESPHGLCELETDIPAAEHDEVLGNVVELQRFDVRQRPAFG